MYSKQHFGLLIAATSQTLLFDERHGYIAELEARQCVQPPVRVTLVARHSMFCYKSSAKAVNGQKKKNGRSQSTLCGSAKRGDVQLWAGGYQQHPAPWKKGN
ncbi:uncharacterized protein TrAtP1_008082 [Trichoderma atroviride]|uniref:uncharacterized protein n=1 Tax=Hypocrea atroviridis TaxID=63577 RepID=UPI003332F155|nr:hypothetical protein TrAtP1_008082 [Trichoderma atroviride]